MYGRQLFGIQDTENDAFNKDGEFATRQTVNCRSSNNRFLIFQAKSQLLILMGGKHKYRVNNYPNDLKELRFK